VAEQVELIATSLEKLAEKQKEKKKKTRSFWYYLRGILTTCRGSSGAGFHFNDIFGRKRN